MNLSTLIQRHVDSLAYLRKLDTDSTVSCNICGGFQPEPERCGCGGFQLVREAVAHHESQLEILAK
jgi:hypothetical protein